MYECVSVCAVKSMFVCVCISVTSEVCICISVISEVCIRVSVISEVCVCISVISEVCICISVISEVCRIYSHQLDLMTPLQRNRCMYLQHLLILNPIKSIALWRDGMSVLPQLCGFFI